MNILLLNGLPESYEGIPISADFRNMVQVDLILSDPELSETEKTALSLHQLYPTIPDDIHKAVSGLAWFYSRGTEPRRAGADDRSGSLKKSFDFEQDANLIYAAFYATYGINLATVNFLHWWEFMALFEGLPETTLIQRVIYWRSVDVADLPKEEKKYILKMRKTFSLKRETQPIALDVETLNRQTKERVAQRFAEARATLIEKKDK